MSGNPLGTDLAYSELRSQALTVAAGVAFPAGARAGQILKGIDPKTLQAGRPDLVADRLARQADLIKKGAPRRTMIQVTEQGVIYDGNRGAAAAAKAGVTVDVHVIDATVAPKGPVSQLPIRPGGE